MIQPDSGTLILARPMVHAATFRRTVLLLCEHGDDGSFGLMLNRRLDLAMEDIMGALEMSSVQLSLGGPVQADTLHFLHRLGEQIPGGIPVLEGVTWGGNFETARALLNADEVPRHDVRFFMGYAGWGPGQLQDEMEENAWIVAPATAEYIFSDDADGLWQSVLRGMGGDYAVMANFPENPRMN